MAGATISKRMKKCQNFPTITSPQNSELSVILMMLSQCKASVADNKLRKRQVAACSGWKAHIHVLKYHFKKIYSRFRQNYQKVKLSVLTEEAACFKFLFAVACKCKHHFYSQYHCAFLRKNV